MKKASEVYSVEEAAKLLGVGRNTAYNAANSGDLPSIRIGRSIKIPKAALTKFMETHVRQVAEQNQTPVAHMMRRHQIPSVTINFRIPVELNNLLIESATARGVSLSMEIRTRLSQTFENK